MADLFDINNPAIRSPMAALLARLEVMRQKDPASPESILRLFDQDVRDDFLARGLLSILPSEISIDGMEALLDGSRTVPDLMARRDPEKGARPGARGRYLGLHARQQALEADIARQRERLEALVATHAAGQHELEDADRRLRAVAWGHIEAAIADMTVGSFDMGPAYTILRACSRYLQIDLAWEKSLDERQRADLAAHRECRKDRAGHLMDRLDLLCGDVALEIAIFDAVLAIVDVRYAEIETEIARRNDTTRPLSRTAKRARRRYDQRRASVHKDAPVADRREVLEGLRYEPSLLRENENETAEG